MLLHGLEHHRRSGRYLEYHGGLAALAPGHAAVASESDRGDLGPLGGAGVHRRQRDLTVADLRLHRLPATHLSVEVSRSRGAVARAPGGRITGRSGPAGAVEHRARIRSRHLHSIPAALPAGGYSDRAAVAAARSGSRAASGWRPRATRTTGRAS